jgi:hypothetical protein
VGDPRAAAADSLDPMSERELVLGWEGMVGGRWTLGVRGVARELEEAIDDTTLDRVLWEVYGVSRCNPAFAGSTIYCGPVYRIVNPGSDFDGWYDLDGDGELDPIEFTAEELGLPDAERTYLALELSAARRFADGWSLGASYTWSHLYGNYAGFTNSDDGLYYPYGSRTFDVAGNMEHSDGDLPNDRRHNLKFFGSYAFDFGLQLSANAWFQSGRPISAYGLHPTDPWARAAGPHGFYNQGTPCQRGCTGVTDDAWALDLGVSYSWPWLGADWFVRVDSRNVFNNASVVSLDQYAELENGGANPNFLQPRYFQEPRTVRFGFGTTF